jgi:hypothetical protein
MKRPQKSPRRVDPIRPNPEESPRPLHPRPIPLERMETPDAGPPPPPPFPPLPPLPKEPPPPNPWLGGYRFWMEIDWSVGLSEDAARRIGKELRRAVFEELGQLEHVSELVIRESDSGGSRGLQISQTRD